MESINDKQLIQALRCSSSVPPEDAVCTECHYSLVEEWYGEKICSCDCDRIGMDAAARLEELTKDSYGGDIIRRTISKYKEADAYV